MDHNTFQDPEVVKRLEDYVKIKYQAEDISNPPGKDVLTLFEGVGLPHYAILKPGTEPGEPRSRGRHLPGAGGQVVASVAPISP